MSKFRMSCRKTNLPTREEAERYLGVVQVLNLSKGKPYKNKWLHTYYCRQCQAWHVGHSSAAHRRKSRESRGQSPEPEFTTEAQRAQR